MERPNQYSDVESPSQVNMMQSPTQGNMMQSPTQGNMIQSPAQGNIMQSPTEGTSQSTKYAKPKATTRKLVLDAIRQLKNPKGSSFADIKKFLSSKTEWSDVADFKTLKAVLTDAVDRGVLTKEDGKYKIKETVRKKRAKSKISPRAKGKSGSPKKKTRLTKRSTGQKTKRRSPSKKKRSAKISQA